MLLIKSNHELVLRYVSLSGAWVAAGTHSEPLSTYKMYPGAPEYMLCTRVPPEYILTVCLGTPRVHTTGVCLGTHRECNMYSYTHIPPEYILLGYLQSAYTIFPGTPRVYTITRTWVPQD